MEKIVNELNQFLEGNYMAIHAYENYIHHTNDSKMKEVLQKIQKQHKYHASLIAERIQNVGGVAVDDSGFKGKMVEWMQKVTKSTHGIEDILRDAIAGEQRGIKVSREILEGDLDDESLQLVKQILDQDEKHVQKLTEILHGL